MLIHSNTTLGQISSLYLIENKANVLIDSKYKSNDHGAYEQISLFSDMDLLPAPARFGPRPLLAIAEAAGGPWPKKARLALLLSAPLAFAQATPATNSRSGWHNPDQVGTPEGQVGTNGSQVGTSDLQVGTNGGWVGTNSQPETDNLNVFNTPADELTEFERFER